jgi:hypothetical protein
MGPYEEKIIGILSDYLKVPKGVLIAPPDVVFSSPNPAPQSPLEPWATKIGRSGLRLNLPAPKGASFEGYIDWKLKPDAVRFDGVGLNYRHIY